MKNRRVLIVGGAGITGRQVVRRLAARGAVITVASRHAVAARFLRPMGDVGQIAAIDVGIGEEATMARLVEGSDIVICAAGTLSEKGGNRFDTVYRRGPAALARHAAASGVKRFVHFSVIGNDPRSPCAYLRAKAAGEAAVREAFPAATILRPSLIFGPDDQAINALGALAKLAPAMPVLGNGGTRYQPVFVGDVADAVTAVLDRADSEGKIFELGGPEIVTYRQLLEMILRIVGRKRLLVPVPAPIAAALAFPLEFLPVPPLTRDQVKLALTENVVGPGMPGLEALGVVPTALGLILPTYLDRFRKGGRFAPVTQAP